ncbi:putative immunoglobulin-blocking virulence protein [Mycoplasmopsis synoviae]|uniref:putative immunoglobulin-blocking virulence protein n=1 Tax=Mycoplasmopsis synoviae TaxID=2109 RepID=UPI00356A6BDD
MIKVKKNKIILLFGIASAALVSTAAISATVVKINSSYLSNQNAFAFNRSRSLELIDRGRAESRFNSNTDNNLEVPKPKKNDPIKPTIVVNPPIVEEKPPVILKPEPPKEEPIVVVAPPVQTPPQSNSSYDGSIINIQTITSTVTEKNNWANLPRTNKIDANTQAKVKAELGKVATTFNQVFKELKPNADGSVKFTEEQKEQLADSLGVPAEKKDWFFNRFLKNFEEGSIARDIYNMVYRDRSTAQANRDMFLHAINNIDYNFFFSVNNVPYIKWEYGDDITIGGKFLSDSENPVLNHQINLNKKRFLSSDSKWRRYSPQMIADNDYFGWKQEDITSTAAQAIGISDTSGIKISKYTPEQDNATVTDKSTVRYALTLDASNPNAYAAVIRNLNLMNQHNYKVEVFNVKHLGVDKSQDFAAVFRAMPDTIKLLNLFFDDTNTDALSGLKDKKIQSLGLWTTKNQLDENWGIDPYVLKNVENIEYDYQNSQSGDYPRGAEIAGSIIFRKLRFHKDDTIPQIQEGLKIALIDKSDLRVFQGYWGSGSWPSELDFSNIVAVKSLKGFTFGPANDLVFKKLTLFNDTFNYVLSASDLSDSGFRHMLFKDTKPSEINFSNQGSTFNSYQIYIPGNTSDLKSNWVPQLQGLLYGGGRTFKKTIYVDNQEMAQRLSKSGVPGLYGFSVQVKPNGYDPNKNEASLDFSS